MELLAPWSLLGLALVPAIFLWGLWAPRGRRVVVGSLLLWRRVIGTGPTGRPSPRLRLRNPLLWLDAATILLVVLACARPAVHRSIPEGPVATLVIDRSAGMARGPVRPWGELYLASQQMVRDVLRQIGDVPLRVVQAPGDLGTDATELVTSLDPAAGDRLWRPVLAARDVWPVAIAEAAAHPDTPVLVATAAAPREKMPANVYVFAPGAESANVGLVRAATRVEGDRWWLLVSARAAPTAKGAYTLVAQADRKECLRVPAFITAGATVERVFPMEGPPPKRIALSLGGPDDGLAADNDAFLAWEPAQGLRVLMIGQADEALRRALAAREHTTVVESPGLPEVRPEEADLLVAVGAGLPAEWKGPAVLVMPPAGAGPVVPGATETKPEWKVAGVHPLAEALYLEPPQVAKVRAYRLQEGAELLAGTPDVPLLATWTAAGARRLAVLFPLDTQTTDWPRRAGFPVFWRYALDWLAPRTGRAGGHATHLPLEVRKGPATPREPGFFAVAGGGTAGVSFIGTGAGFETGPGRDDSVAALAAIRASMGGRHRESSHEVWPWLAAGVLGLLFVRTWLAR